MKTSDVLLGLLCMGLLVGCTAITTTVAYDGNGEEEGAAPVDSRVYPEGEVVVVLGNTGNLARTGYTLSGWNTQADGAGTPYNPGDAFIAEAFDVTLYAVWIPSASGVWNGFIPGRELLLQLGADNTFVFIIDQPGPQDVYEMSGSYGNDIGQSLLSLTLASSLHNGSTIPFSSIPGYSSNPVIFGCSVTNDLMTLSGGLFGGFGFAGNSTLIRN